MKQIFSCLFTISVFILLSQNLIAQAIEAGIWTGAVAHPDGKTSEVKYDVQIIGDTLSIIMKSRTMGNCPLPGIKQTIIKALFETDFGCELKTCIILQ
jgi:hypothetical protein